MSQSVESARAGQVRPTSSDGSSASCPSATCPSASCPSASHPQRPITLQEIPRFEAEYRRTGQIPTLRIRRRTTLQKIDLAGSLRMLLSLNGMRLRFLHPGCNTFDPPLKLQPRDRLRLDFCPEAARRPSAERRPPSSGNLPDRTDALVEQDVIIAAFGEDKPGAQATTGPDSLPFSELTALHRRKRSLLDRLLSW